MKKILSSARVLSFLTLSVALFFCFPVLTKAESIPKLMMSEVMYNPAGEDKIIMNNRERSRQWIEIYNPNDSPITIIGGIGEKVWMLFDSTGAHFFAKTPLQGTMTIPAKEFAVLAGDANLFLQEYPSFKGTVIDVKMELQHLYDIVTIKDERGEVVMRGIWSSNLGGNGNGKTLEFSLDNTPYESSVIGGTPGMPNSIPKPTEPRQSPLLLPSPTEQPLLPPEVIAVSDQELSFFQKGKVIINEIFLGDSSRWIEIKNLDLYPINLTNWKLTAKSSGQQTFLSGSVSAQGLMVVKLPSSFVVQRNGDTLKLFDSSSQLIFQVEFTKPFPYSWSAARFDSIWKLTSKPTPNQENELLIPKSINYQEIPQEIVPDFAFKTQSPKITRKNLSFVVLGTIIAVFFSVCFMLIKKRFTF